MSPEKPLIQEMFQAFDPAETLPVMEHFYSLQGEGAWAGVPAYFIRVAGCDVGCVWCDVKESWEVKADQLMEIQQLVTLVDSSGCGLVILTGGEPAMYDLSPITRALKRAGIRVHLETSGAYPIRGEFDWVCLSPKKFRPPLAESYSLADELKVIVFNQQDFKWAESEAARCNPEKTMLILQAEWGRKEQFYPKIVDYVKSNPHWRLSLQTHKYVHIP